MRVARVLPATTSVRGTRGVGRALERRLEIRQRIGHLRDVRRSRRRAGRRLTRIAGRSASGSRWSIAGRSASGSRPSIVDRPTHCSRWDGRGQTQAVEIFQHGNRLRGEHLAHVIRRHHGQPGTTQCQQRRGRLRRRHRDARRATGPAIHGPVSRHGHGETVGTGPPQLLANLARRAQQPRQAADVEHHQRPHHFEARCEVLGDGHQRVHGCGARIQAGKHGATPPPRRHARSCAAPPSRAPPGAARTGGW